MNAVTDMVLVVDLLSTCETPCPHTDCAVGREIADTQCAGCYDPIGYGQRYRYGPGGVDIYHADCWDEVSQATPETEAVG